MVSGVETITVKTAVLQVYRGFTAKLLPAIETISVWADQYSYAVCQKWGHGVPNAFHFGYDFGNFHIVPLCWLWPTFAKLFVFRLFLLKTSIFSKIFQSFSRYAFSATIYSKKAPNRLFLPEAQNSADYSKGSHFIFEMIGWGQLKSGLSWPPSSHTHALRSKAALS